MPETKRRTDDRLRLSRLARGLSQGELAKTAGVTRQAISGIESGRWLPSLDVALLLATALGSSVEELFGEPAAGSPTAARLAVRSSVSRGDELPMRVQLAEVSGDTVAFPLEGDSSLVPGFVPAIAVVDVEPSGSSVTAQPLAESRLPAIAVAGCDPALALLRGPLARHKPPVELTWWPCGNTKALELLGAGAVHAAGIHRKVDSRPRRRAGLEAVGFACWSEGLALSPRLSGTVTDLAGIVTGGFRIANREKGSEARRLLDEELARLRIDPADVAGYDTETSAHLLAASAVASGLADAAVTTEPAALAYGLGFVGWQEEISELLIPRSLAGSVELRALLDVLGGRELPRQLASLGGYDSGPCGSMSSA